MNIEDITYKPKTNFSYSMRANYEIAVENCNRNNLIPLYKAKPDTCATSDILERYDWIYGQYVTHYTGNFIVDDTFRFIPIDRKTLCTCIGHKDIENNYIFTNDILYMKTSYNEDRLFLATYGQYVREMVSFEGFCEPTSKCQINGFSFNWISNQLHYDLLPNVDEDNNSDIDKMRIIGNIFDDSDLAEFYRNNLRRDTYGWCITE